VLILIAGLASGALAQVSSASTVSIPGLRGLTSDQAIAAARAQGITASIGATRAAPDPKGTVIEQSPSAGAFSSSRRVTLVVSGGPAPVAVPKIVNVSWDQAKKALDAAGLIYAATPATQFSDSIAAGNVISVAPGAGTSIAPDGKVTVVVSSGHAPVAIPDVENLSYDDAVRALTAKNFKPRRAATDEFSDTVASGDVTRTEPAIGANAPYGSEVVVHVSKGPDLVLVPSVFGMTFTDALDYLAQFGFQTSTVGSFRPHDRVQQQSPAADSKAPRNSTVTIRR
jgi:eukaryotic-like serine/threonine-protein kinase